MSEGTNSSTSPTTPEDSVSSSTPPSPPGIKRSETDEAVAIKKIQLADELEREILDRKQQLNLELEEEKRLKLEERKALAYRLQHGIDSDSEDEEEQEQEKEQEESDQGDGNITRTGTSNSGKNDDDDVRAKEEMIRHALQLRDQDNYSDSEDEDEVEQEQKQEQEQSDRGDGNITSTGTNNSGKNDDDNVRKKEEMIRLALQVGDQDNNRDELPIHVPHVKTSISSTGTSTPMNSFMMDSVNLSSIRVMGLGNKLHAEGASEGEGKNVNENVDEDKGDSGSDLEDLISEGDVQSSKGDENDSNDDLSLEDDDDKQGENEVPSGDEMTEEPQIEETQIEDEANLGDGDAALEADRDQPQEEQPELVIEENAGIDNDEKDSISPEFNSIENTVGRNQFYQHLKHGFDFVYREVQPTSPKKDTKKDDDSFVLVEGLPPSYAESLQQTPLVNFIDPTSSTIQKNSDETSPSRHMKRRAWNRDRPKLKLRELHIFEKFETVFHEQHNGTLRSVPYKSTRTNAIENIKYLPIRTNLTVPTILDPAEWHNSPICHVYIAACCSVEHYRAKVRPSLKAFVNQIDGAGSGNQIEAINAAKEASRKEFGAKNRGDNKREQVAAANKAVAAAKDAAGGNTSSKYLIIFVPIRPSSVDNELPNQVEDASKGGGLGLRGRLAAAAARRNSNMQTEKSAGDEEQTTTDDGPSVSSQVFMLSKEHKEVHKKFLADFPNGKTCILTTLLDSDNNLASESPIQKQEFHTVCQELGKTVLSGFDDRVQRYNEELKRLEHEQTVPGSPSRKKDKEFVDWRQYFLIKDSIALTFEQMKLPMEAMYQYEDLEAKIPVGSLLEIEQDSCPDNIKEIAMNGRAESFRKIVKSLETLDDIQHLVNMYLFARQAQLLFLQRLPRDVVNKCLTYVKRMHKVRSNQAYALSSEEGQIARLKNEIWSVSACWDLKSASEMYTSRLLQSSRQPTAGPPASPTRKSVRGVNEKSYISAMCDVLNYARIRLLKISEMTFPPDSRIRKAVADYPSDALETWCPWSDPQRTIGPSSDDEPTSHPPLVPSKIWDQGSYTEWIVNGLESDKCYEDIYIEVCDCMIQMNTFLKRSRTVSRILAELAEIYILKGDLEAAVENLLMTIDNCLQDPWDKLLAWRVFRLACCQRRVSNAPEYLKSLTYCLGSRLSNAVPIKLRHLLTRDLQAIVFWKEISEFRWNISPLFGIKLSIHGTPLGKSVQPLLKTDVVMHTCEIGHKVQAEIVLESNLAESIEVDRVDLYLLRVDDYQRLAEASDEVTESDAAFVLSTETPIDIEPGDNVFKFPWDAMSVGQFVIASVCLHWKHAAFYHDFTTTSNNVMGFDVLPNEPTQSIELNPIFLIPGHVQNVRLVFHSGSDVVNGGTVKLTCSQGLQVMPPFEESEDTFREWQDTCEFDLGNCLPNSTKTLIASVKSEAIDSYDPNAQHDDDYSFSALQTLDAMVTTSYHHGLFMSLVEENKPIDSPPITAILEASITTLELAALTIKTSASYALDNDSFMISATVLCNTPVPFSLKEWQISLPSTLQLSTDGDLNLGLYNKTVIEGEELFFGFHCKRSAAADKLQVKDAILSMVLQDQFGKSFRQVLPLDIHAIERFLVVDDDDAEEAIAIADLTASALQGLVGSPVTLTYDIDCGSLGLDSTSQLLYHLSSSDADWIIGGSVRGTITFSSDFKSSLSFVGVPTKAGTIKCFPRIEISAVQILNDSLATPKGIKVRENHMQSFLSLAHTTVDAMALSSLCTEI